MTDNLDRIAEAINQHYHYDKQSGSRFLDKDKAAQAAMDELFKIMREEGCVEAVNIALFTDNLSPPQMSWEDFSEKAKADDLASGSMRVIQRNTDKAIQAIEYYVRGK